MKPLVISVSFKNSYSEFKLYNWLTTKSGYSAYIKDLLKREMEKEKLEDVKR